MTYKLFRSTQHRGQAMGKTEPSTATLLFGAGTSSVREVTTKNGINFFEFRLEQAGATGDNRGIYLRLYLSGAGAGGGESLRAFTTIEAAKGTAHGAHISLNFSGGGVLSGLGVAVRGTLHLPDAAGLTGTLAAIQPEIWADGDESNAADAQVSLIRPVIGGDATGAATVLNFMDLSAVPAAADGAFINTNATVIAASAYAALKVLLPGGVVKYLHLFDAS